MSDMPKERSYIAKSILLYALEFFGLFVIFYQVKNYDLSILQYFLIVFGYSLTKISMYHKTKNELCNDYE